MRVFYCQVSKCWTRKPCPIFQPVHKDVQDVHQSCLSAVVGQHTDAVTMVTDYEHNLFESRFDSLCHLFLKLKLVYFHQTADLMGPFID